MADIHPPEWYLSVDADLRRDVIERPILDEIDLSGWEIRKALLTTFTWRRATSRTTFAATSSG